MRVLIIVHVYPPEHAPAGVMVRELAEDLVRCGHKVTVLTGFPHQPQGAIFSGWKARCRQSELDRGGFRLVRCRHSFAPGGGLARKLGYYLTFALSTFANGLLEGRCEVVLGLSTPIFGSWSARILASVKRARFVYAIFDLHPEATGNAGLLGERSLWYRLWRAQDTLLCRFSQVVVTLSEGLKREICRRGIDQEKVRVVPFWIDQDRIVPHDRINSWRRRQGIPGRTFTALLAGTIGRVGGADILIEVARRLVGRPDILLLCVGGGSLYSELAATAKAQGLSNIRFLPFQPEAELSDMQATADVGLVTLLPGAGRTSVPSKILGYLAAGRPVIASVDAESETARVILDGQCGEVVPPQNAEALAAAIVRTAGNRAAGETAGRRARQYFLRHYGSVEGTARYREILQQAAAQQAAGCRDRAAGCADNPDPTLRRMVVADVPGVVDVHLRAFPGFFLSGLGPRFLSELYRSFLRDPDVVAFVAPETGTNRILGVVAGPLFPEGFFSRLLKRRWWAFFLASVGPCLRHPRIVTRLLRAIDYRGDPPAGRDWALLSTIAVVPEARRRGIGTRLIATWTGEVRARGAAGCYLTTDAAGNEEVNRFYERAGWRLAQTHDTPEGRRMRLYQLEFVKAR